MQDNNQRKWVWYSTPTSFLHEKVSLLAIIETITACVVYLSIALKFGTLHLTIAALLSPLFLLRTDESTLFALEYFSSYKKIVNSSYIIIGKPKKLQSLFRYKLIETIFHILCVLGVIIMYYYMSKTSPGLIITVYLFGILLSLSIGTALLFGGLYFIKSLCIRIYATYKFAISNPSKAFSSIPKNWWHQIVCLDSLHPPELVPGIIKYEENKKYISKLQPFGYYYATTIFSETHPDYRPISHSGFKSVQIRNLATSIFLAFTSYTYRWSIKGTSLLMFPLIFLVYDSKDIKPKHIKNSLLIRFLFGVSIFILLSFILILVKSMWEIDLTGIYEPLTKLLSAHDPHGLLKQVFPKDTILIWQIFLLITAFLTFCCYLFADRCENRGYGRLELQWLKYQLWAIGISTVCLIFSLIYLSASLTLLSQAHKP